MAFLSAPPAAHAYTQVLWTWIDVGGFRPEIAFYLDPLSLIMMLVVTFVSFLIHLYSTEFMIDDDGYSRFFAYMNLFVASMLTLLLANNLLLLYLGWEGVGPVQLFAHRLLVSGSGERRGRPQGVHRDPRRRYRHGDRPVSAFPRSGHAPDPGTDAAGLAKLAHRVARRHRGRAVAAGRRSGQIGATAACRRGCRMRWPDPLPTSALIHAATMVTAGVYLIARTHVLYSPRARRPSSRLP